MEELKKEKKKNEIGQTYGSGLDGKLSSSADSGTSGVKYVIIPVYTDKNDGTYKIPAHVGRKGAKSGESYATGLLILNLETMQQAYKDLISPGIVDAEKPGIELCKFIIEEYQNKVVLITSNELKLDYEGDLERKIKDLIINKTLPEKTDANEAIKYYRKSTEDKEEKYEEAEKEYVAEEVKGEKEEDAREESVESDGDSGE